MSLNRTLAGLIDTAGDVKAASLDNAASGLTVYATLNDLPTTGLTSGDQAYVSATSRFYISNGSGWYNVALVNATPNLTIDPTGTIKLATDGSTTTTITLTATDSDYPDAALTFSVDSDGSFGGLATISQDSSVFTITPLSQDSATTSISTLTFKASDGISFGSGSRTLTLSFKVQYSNYTTALLKADTAGTDNQVDASSNSHTITENGDVTSTAFTPYHPGGYSTYFDGSGDYLTVPHDTSFDFGTGDFTVEFWIYASSYAGTQSVVGTYNNGGSSGFLVQIDGTNIRIYKGGTSLVNTSASSYLNANTWNHIAVTRSGTDLLTFVDGILIDTTTNSTDFTYTGSLYIGRLNHSSVAQYVLGYINDLRIVKGSAVYTSAFTPPTEPLTAISGTSLLSCHLPYIADGSSNDHSVTIFGDPTTIRIAPYDYLGYTKTDHLGSLYCDGTADYLSIANDTSLDFGTGDWTIECWVYKTGSFKNYDCPWSKFVSNAGYWIHISSSGQILLGNSGTSYATSTETIKLNTWHHLATVRSGGVIKVYLDGVATSISLSYSGDNDNTTPFLIGAMNGYSRNFEGYMSDFRIVKGTAVYTSNFTPPTARLTAIANTSLLTCTNKNNIWDAGSGSLLTKYGNTTSSNTQRKFATSSAIYFDGSGDWIHLPASDKLEPLGNNFTFEWWWYPTTLSQRQWFFHTATDYWLGVDFQNTSGRGLGMWASSNGSSWNLINSDNGGNGISSTNPTLNAWNHIAYTRNGSTFTLWLNGTSIVSVGSITASIVDRSAQSKVIGSWAQTNHQFPIVGYIQDFRVTKGLARYTSSFTPPTAEFDG